MILEPLTQQLLTQDKRDILRSAPEHGAIQHTDMSTYNGVKMHMYSAKIPGIEGDDTWQVSIGNHVHAPGGSISLLGFARNGDTDGRSTDFAISGASFARHVLPKVLAHHIKTMKESGRDVTALTMGAEDISPEKAIKKQRAYQRMFDGFEPNETPEAKASSDMFKNMFGKPQEMPMFSFHVPRHLSVI